MKLIDHNFRRSIAKGVSPLPVGVCSIDATAASRDVFFVTFFHLRIAKSTSVLERNWHD